MTERIVRLSIYLIVASIVIVIFVFMFRPPGTSNDRNISLLAGRFMATLPKDLKDDELQEIAGIFARFRMNANAGNVSASDWSEIEENLKGYIEHGKISRDELNYFMAKVTFFTHRSDPGYNPSERDVGHPLLTPDTIRSDTTTRRAPEGTN